MRVDDRGFLFVFGFELFLLCDHLVLNRLLERVGKVDIRQHHSNDVNAIFLRHRVLDHVLNKGRDRGARFNDIHGRIGGKRRFCFFHRNALYSVCENVDRSVLIGYFECLRHVYLVLHRHGDIHRLRVLGIGLRHNFHILNLRVVDHVRFRYPKIEMRACRTHASCFTEMLDDRDLARIYRMEAGRHRYEQNRKNDTDHSACDRTRFFLFDTEVSRGDECDTADQYEQKSQNYTK